MKCKKCGNDVRPDSQFCTTCGSPLVITNSSKGVILSRYILGVIILLLGIVIGWGWITYCDFYGCDGLFAVIGLYAIAFLVITFLEFIAWMNNKKNQALRKFLRVSSFLALLALTFFGLMIGLAWGRAVEIDYYFAEGFLGVTCGFSLGGIVVAYILIITSPVKTPS